MKPPDNRLFRMDFVKFHEISRIQIIIESCFIIFRSKKLLSVCEKPIYIEVREKLSKRDWTGSESFLIHQVKSSKDWASGFSKDFG